jgi:DNA polymerase-3 subunit epsilon
MVIGLGALWLLRDALDDHLRDLARLHALTVALRARDEIPAIFPVANDYETTQLRESLLALAEEITVWATTPDRRLAAVLAAVSEPLIVVTASGQVSLVNRAAREALGEERVALGTSVFAALVREPVETALAAARAAGGSAKAPLETVNGHRFEARISLFENGEGAVITLPREHTGGAGDVAHDLSLHDLPPSAPPPDESTLLTELPVTVLDLETTGLDPARDRIVAIGAVRMHGPAIFRASTFDCLVNPGVPIPRASTAIHGIGDSTVAAVPSIAVHLPKLMDLVSGRVVVGHSIGFDLKTLSAEAARAGLPWEAPLALDTLQIVAALDPREEALDLEHVVVRHGLAVLGRHTALGDALMTAELWRLVIARLADRGVRTLGEAQAFCATATHVIARQRARGW